MVYFVLSIETETGFVFRLHSRGYLNERFLWQDNTLKALGRVPDIAEDALVAVLKAVVASGAEGALDAYVGRLAAYPVTRGPLRAALRAQLDAEELTSVLELLDSRVRARDGVVLAEVNLVLLSLTE
jgi:hypothetical protein